MPNSLKLPVLALWARAKSRVLSGELPGFATWPGILISGIRPITCKSRRIVHPDVLTGLRDVAALY